MGARSHQESIPLTYQRRSRRGVRTLLAGSALSFTFFLACGSEVGPSASDGKGQPDAAGREGGFVNDASRSTPDPSSPSEPRPCTPAVPGNGPDAPEDAYYSFCSPKCGAGQFCLSVLDVGIDREDPDLDAGDKKATKLQAYPLLCEGCHPMPECDGGDPCACLRAQLPEDVCDGTGFQCRVREGGFVHFRCLTIVTL